MPRWSVDIIRKHAEHLGEVDAPDEAAAIKLAAEVFDIPVERQNRILVTTFGSECAGLITATILRELR